MYTVKELIEILSQCPQDYGVQVYSANLIGSINTVGIDHNEQIVDLFTGV